MDNPTAYRYPNEQAILFITLLLVLGVIAISATATLCSSVLFIAAMLALAYFSTRLHHQDLVRQAQPVTPQTQPQMHALLRECSHKLQAERVDLFIAPSRTLNAYAFGLATPKAVVLNAPLFQLMDVDELRFILGHELGHVRLGHTWLNSLVGGMAGIPSPAAALAVLHLAFRWWNRACEFSADRAGLLACGRLDKAVSALVRLATGTASRSPAAMAQAYARVDAQDDDLSGQLTELLATHPLIIRRVEALKAWAATPEYRRLQAQLESANRPTS